MSFFRRRGCIQHILFAFFFLVLTFFLIYHTPHGKGRHAFDGLDNNMSTLLKSTQQRDVYRKPIHLTLQLTDDIKSQHTLINAPAMMTQYGFNLNLSNSLPLDRYFPDYRAESCKLRTYPSPNRLLKCFNVSVMYYKFSLILKIMCTYIIYV